MHARLAGAVLHPTKGMCTFPMNFVPPRAGSRADACSKLPATLPSKASFFAAGASLRTSHVHENRSHIPFARKNSGDFCWKQLETTRPPDKEWLCLRLLVWDRQQTRGKEVHVVEHGLWQCAMWCIRSKVLPWRKKFASWPGIGFKTAAEKDLQFLSKGATEIETCGTDAESLWDQPYMQVTVHTQLRTVFD